MGRTGAGKSTVFQLLLGLYPPESGSVTIGGVEVSAISDGERRGCISCVEQRFSRVPGTVLPVSHRVYENLGGRTLEIKPQNREKE